MAVSRLLGAAQQPASGTRNARWWTHLAWNSPMGEAKPLGRVVGKSWKWLSSDDYREVGQYLRMCALLPVCGLLGMSVDDNHELRLQLDFRKLIASVLPAIDDRVWMVCLWVTLRTASSSSAPLPASGVARGSPPSRGTAFVQQTRGRASRSEAALPPESHRHRSSLAACRLSARRAQPWRAAHWIESCRVHRLVRPMLAS